MSYDDWKLMTPEEADGTAYDEYVPVDVKVEIYYGDEASERKTIKIDALLTCDDFEKECYIRDEDLQTAVAEYLGNRCEYEILNWDRI